MTPGETFFLGLVILTLCSFGGTLAVVSWVERRWAKKHSK